MSDTTSAPETAGTTDTPGAETPIVEGFILHEWSTLTAFQGADGTPLEGLQQLGLSRKSRQLAGRNPLNRAVGSHHEREGIELCAGLKRPSGIGNAIVAQGAHLLLGGLRRRRCRGLIRGRVVGVIGAGCRCREEEQARETNG